MVAVGEQTGVPFCEGSFPLRGGGASNKLRKLCPGHVASVLEAHNHGAINEKLGYQEFLER